VALPKAKAGFRAIERGDLDQALKSFEQAVAADERDLDGWLGMARVRLSRGDEAGARPAFERVLKLQPNHPEAAAQLVMIRVHAGDPKAMDDLIALTKAKDAGFYAYFNLGKVLAAKQDWVGAKRAYSQALALEPKSPFPHVELAMIALEEKDTASAVDHFRQAADVDPSDWEPLYYLARARLMRGEVGQAAIDILEAIDRSPHNQRLRADLVKVCIAAGNTKGALIAGEKLFAEFPDEPQALHLYGVALLTAGQVQQAKEAVEEALRRAPDAADIRATLDEIKKALDPSLRKK
jgi:Flp pilus assembly protein TadD